MRIREICVVGLGYVGTPLAAKLAAVGFSVIGHDRDPKKVRAIQKCSSPLGGKEPRLGKMIAASVKAGRLTASLDPKVIKGADAVFVCVETPFDMKNRAPDYGPLLAAVTTAGRNLRKGAVVIVESTLAPGTTMKIVLPALERATGGRSGKAFHLAHCPERVMPGRLLTNLESYNRVIGAVDKKAAEACLAIYQKVTKGDLDVTDPTTAEVVKTTENAYRDVQIAFANEIALASEEIGVDAFRVRELVNKCPFREMHYPGAGVGGHCIPKDGLLLSYATGDPDLTRMIHLAREINDGMPRHMASLVRSALAGQDLRRPARLLVLGYSFLGDSDDARNTPAKPFIDLMRRDGLDIRVHEPLATIPRSLKREHDLLEGCAWADVVALVTSHSLYSGSSRQIIRAMRRGSALVDGRNVFPRHAAETRGIAYFGVGKPAVR